MELDEIRQEVIELVAKISPLMQQGVWNPDAYRSHYLTPYRARDLKSLQAYEKTHKTIFCRECITTNEKKGLLLAYQLWIEETDNGLENKPGEWVSLQCQNPDCDFDLVTPRPIPTYKPGPDLQRMMNQPMWVQAGGTWTDATTGGWIKAANTQCVSPGTITVGPAAQGQALSSASTSGLGATPAPAPQKLSLLDRLVNKYIK